MPRGGMCKNPFAGNPSMNELDDEWMAALFKGELTVDQTVALRVIKMSVRDYLYFGLGANHITPERFLEAYSYLFKVRGQDSKTWGDCTISERFRTLDGVSETRKGTVQSEEVKAKCFDTHYDLSGLSVYLPISGFLRKLKQKREVIIKTNEKQMLAYMDEYRRQEWRTLARRKGKLAFARVDVTPLLTAPEDVKAFAMLYLFGRVPRPSKTKVQNKLPNTLKYKKLIL